jgi:hypothetical protein
MPDQVRHDSGFLLSEVAWTTCCTIAISAFWATEFVTATIAFWA